MNSHQSSVLFLLSLFSIIVVSGCAVDKRPEAYSNAIEVNSVFPAHGSSLAQYAELQNALLSRNLLIADNGDVLPVMKDMCEVDMLYRMTNANLPPYIGQHQDLYSGFYLDVALVNDDWHVVSTDNDFVTFEPGFAVGLLATFLNIKVTSTDIFVVRPQSGISADVLENLLLNIKSLLPTKHLYFVVPSVLAEQVERAGYRAILNHAAASHLYLAQTLSTTAAQDRIFLRLDNNANAQVLMMAVRDKPLMACMQNHNFVLPSDQVFNGKFKTADLPSVVSVLPSNADFNQLNQQQKLFESGQYLTIAGDILTYATYQNLQATSRCGRLKPSDPLFKYCQDRKQDVATEFERRKATMKKQER